MHTRLASRAFERILIPHWLKYSHFVFDGTCVVSVLGACKFRGYKSVYCVPVIYRAETYFEKYKELEVGLLKYFVKHEKYNYFI